MKLSKLVRRISLAPKLLEPDLSALLAGCDVSNILLISPPILLKYSLHLRTYTGHRNILLLPINVDFLRGSGQWGIIPERGTVMDVVEQKNTSRVYLTEWTSTNAFHVCNFHTEYVYSRSALQAVKGPRPPQTALHTLPNYLPFCARGLRAEHRKEGNHTNLNNAEAQSLHYDLVNGWLYKLSDPSELPCLTAQAACDELLRTRLLLSYPEYIQCFNFVQLQRENSEKTGCVSREVIWHFKEIPHSELRELKGLLHACCKQHSLSISKVGLNVRTCNSTNWMLLFAC